MSRADSAEAPLAEGWSDQRRRGLSDVDDVGRDGRRRPAPQMHVAAVTRPATITNCSEEVAGVWQPLRVIGGTIGERDVAIGGD